MSNNEVKTVRVRVAVVRECRELLTELAEHGCDEFADTDCLKAYPENDDGSRPYSWCRACEAKNLLRSIPSSVAVEAEVKP